MAPSKEGPSFMFDEIQSAEQAFESRDSYISRVVKEMTILRLLAEQAFAS
jgi:hypothetical protein